MNGLTFDQWWAELQAEADYIKWPLGDQESYRDYYDDGDSPKDALKEEVSYGAY